MSFARSIIFDVFQVQGDLIVGTETLPITLGEKRCLVLLKITLLFAGFMLVLSPLFGLASPFSYLILFSLFGLSLCLLAYERHWLYPGPTLEALVESNFFLTGLLACIWRIT
jgi:4-hydroxy-3-methylbut-2-enyl diphosphate reductase